MSALPQVIILYGPPAAGKGTQANKLQELLPEYYHLDFGTELRKFVTDHLGDYNAENNTITASSSPELVAIAERIKIDLPKGPVRTEDLRFVVEKAITDNINQGKGMIVEGPGRLIEEAIWLSDFFRDRKVTVAIFHLHMGLEEAVKRSATRWYIPSNKQSYISYQAAKAECLEGEEPFQRQEDKQSAGVVQRYRLLYSDHFAKIICIYQLNALAQVLTLDAGKTILEVTADINSYLEKFFGFKSN